MSDERGDLKRDPNPGAARRGAVVAVEARAIESPFVCAGKYDKTKAPRLQVEI